VFVLLSSNGDSALKKSNHDSDRADIAGHDVHESLTYLYFLYVVSSTSTQGSLTKSSGPIVVDLGHLVVVSQQKINKV
jgi:hypothetical protein